MMTILLLILEVWASNIDPEAGYVIGFHGFPQSVQVISGILPQIKTCPLPFTSSHCIIQYSSYHSMRYSLTYWCLLKCSWSFVCCVITCVCFLVYSCILFYSVCITLVAECWLQVSIQKVLRPATSAQVFLGFPVSINECWDGSQDSKLILHASHVALPT